MLTVAIPMPRPRLPIQRMEVPTKVIEAVAPFEVDCMAEPALHPELESLFVHAPLKVTAASDSSTRIPAVGSPAVGAGGGGGGALAMGLVPPPPPQDASRFANNRTTTIGM
jgi:hypothetical protein